MDYSPKLKSAMEEIKAIVKKNDIAAFVVLHDKTQHSEYLNEISPSYSCAEFNGIELKIKAKSSELGNEKANRLQHDTYNMFTHFSDIISHHSTFYNQIKNHLKEILGGEDGYTNHTSHQQQNN